MRNILEFFRFVPRPLAGTPGVANQVYEQNTTLPLSDVGGPGQIYMGQLNLLRPNVPLQAVVNLDGLGGLVTGQIALQPLIEQSNN